MNSTTSWGALRSRAIAWMRTGVFTLAWLGVGLRGAELADAQKALRTGDYSQAVELASKASTQRLADEDWPLVWIEGLMQLGRYAEAQGAMTNALIKNPRSIRLRWQARDVARFNGQSGSARDLVDEIRNLVATRPSFYGEAADLVVIARIALLLGSDPKDVLTRVLDPAAKAAPSLRDTYLARGELALTKHDFELAAKAFAEGLKQHPEDADLHYGLARAYADGDREQMAVSLEAALKANPRHVPSLLLLADHRIDAEDYSAAEKLLSEVEKVNPVQPEAWAYRAVLAHLRQDRAAETAARATALKHWTDNPAVDHLIGKKLSQKYRFAEGAERQRSALDFDRTYLPAKAQLASDLLRLGEDAEGWRLAQEIHRTDAYDVAAFNLVTLRDTMAKYATLTNDAFIVRMHSQEAAVFGPRVLQLLSRAQDRLVKKYGVEIRQPTTVEIFHEQKDFGVRTFGMPDNPGFLGVCFGRVITANSPAATKASPVNWEAVLWHEFCHVVTLQMTANRMPRWLSEGISVYEELQENPAWGQRMTPRYRSMILNGDLTPVSKLSGAFLAPKTPFHLQFAYYEASLVVEFVVQRFGIEKLKAVLRNLKEGKEINAVLAEHTQPIDKLEKEFAAFAKARAEGLAPGLDWEEPRKEIAAAGDAEAYAAWIAARPTNYYALLSKAQQQVRAKNWEAAKGPLETLVRLYPEQAGKDSAYPLLAHVHRSLGQTNAEREVLVRYAQQDDEAADAYLRLAELGRQTGDWAEVRRNSERFLAVNPLVAAPYRYLAQSAEALGDLPTAIAAGRTWLQLDPPNPAEVHFQLARLMNKSGDAGARREVLRALEEAPRHRGALDLLWQINSTTRAPAPAEGAKP